MMQYRPTLKISRLIIIKDGRSVYDELFHHGVNIIRGKNSVGKSTIANFINFSLGGEISKLTDEALSCDYVIAEIEINGAILTLKREVSSTSQRPMTIFWDNCENAMKNSVKGWELYPYSAKGSRQSFSQVIFRALEFPSLRVETMSLITMHQILRLLYVDQLTSPYDLFKFEAFDSPDLRDAVGQLLCGIYTDEIYTYKIKLREYENELSLLNKQYQSVIAILGDAEQIPHAREIEGSMARKKAERETIYNKMEELQNETSLESKTLNAVTERREKLRKEIVSIKKAIYSLDEELSGILLDIDDSNLFISELESNLRSIEHSVEIRGSLGEIKFDVCPCCYTSLDNHLPSNVCPLCKQEKSGKTINSSILRMKQEFAIQVNESKTLQENRVKRVSEIKGTLPQLREKLESLMLQYKEYEQNIITEKEAELRSNERRLGYFDREIEDLERQLKLAKSIDRLSNRKSYLSGEITRLKDQISMAEEEVQKRKLDAYDEISRNLVALLHKDLPREDVFRNACFIQFDFRENKVAVDGKSNFSASSLVILKNSFHLALLAASTKKEYFKYPRFLLIDNIEDKGMEVARSHQLQKNIVELSSGLPVEHQIIFSTSMIEPELEKSGLTIGEFYTESNKSLKI